MSNIDRISGQMPPWVNLTKFYSLCDENGISVLEGERHNRTDGEVDYILKKQNGETFVVNASSYDVRQEEWSLVVDWILV